MKVHNPGRIAEKAAAVILVCLLLFASGCNGDKVSREEVEEIDSAFRRGISQLSEVTVFIRALEEFDFENADFLENTLQQIDTSRLAAQGVIESSNELRSFNFEGGLDQLGEYVSEYHDTVVEAMAELETVYDATEEMLEVLRPVLSEEATITQLEAPRNDAEWLDRLRRLDTALGSSLAELDNVRVPGLLEDIKALFTDLLTTMSKLVGDLISVLTRSIPNVEMETNPDFLRTLQLVDGYLPLVQALYDNLEISEIDSLVEQLELEINRLYMGE